MIEQHIPDTSLAPEEKSPASTGDPASYCGYCGTQNAADNRFCVQCGRALTDATGPDAQPRTGAPAAESSPAPAATGTARKARGAGAPCIHERLAGFGARVLAFVIDVVLIGVVSSLLRGVDLRAIASLVDAVYFVAFWSTTGQTLGMRALGIRIVRVDGQPLSWVTGLVRYAGYVLSLIPAGLGLWWVLWDRDRQGWHDKIATTVVVRAD